MKGQREPQNVPYGGQRCCASPTCQALAYVNWSQRELPYLLPFLKIKKYNNKARAEPPMMSRLCNIALHVHRSENTL